MTKLHLRSSKWSPWPGYCESWQRIHADYCGPFLGKYYVLVVMDSFGRWPEVFLTTSANADFTKSVFKKLFRREDIPLVLVADNGTHFTADHLVIGSKVSDAVICSRLPDVLSPMAKQRTLSRPSRRLYHPLNQVHLQSSIGLSRIS